MTQIAKAFYDILSFPREDLATMQAVPTQRQIRLTREELRTLFIAELEAANSTHALH